MKYTCLAEQLDDAGIYLSYETAFEQAYDEMLYELPDHLRSEIEFTNEEVEAWMEENGYLYYN